MNLLDDFSQDLMGSIGMDAQSVFGELPQGQAQALGTGEPQDQSFVNPSSLLSGLDQPPAGASPAQPAAPTTEQAAATAKDGTQWVPGVGFIKKNSGNAAQEWEAAAGSPAPNLSAIQEHNAKLLDPSQGDQGGPGRAPSTARYYTRKLARAQLNNKNSSDETKMQARMALRFNGADSSQSGARGLSGDAWWESFFKNNATNNFGEGTGEHKGDQFVNEPGATGAGRFRYLTDLLGPPDSTGSYDQTNAL